jgi:hypothetical protein
MAYLNQTFNVQDLPKGDGGNYEPLPAGWYSASITAAEIKPTRAGTGEYISVRYDIVGPSHQGRVVFGTFNIRNASPKAEEIGQQQLGELMTAINLPQLSDTDQLIGSNVQIKLAVERNEQYGDKNQVKAYKAAGGAMGASSPAAMPRAAASAPAPAAKSSSPPWAKK